MATGGAILAPYSAPVLDNAGNPVVGATLTINIAGSTIATVYADAALTTPITNPLTSDSAGRLVVQGTVIWADDSQAYDCILNLNNGTSLTFSNLYTVGPQTSTAGLAPINSPTFTGTPQAPTPATNDNSAKIATTAYVQAQGYAPLASPAFTGVPTAPTAAASNNSTQLATTAYADRAAGVTAPTSTTSGYFKWGGVILQWTTFSIGSGAGASVTVNWPLAFPTNVIGLPWTQLASGAGYALQATGASTTQVTLTKSGGDPLAKTGTVWAFGT